jgi:aspartyl/asparaginyl beta-hydroxylase (cupin superfamily)
MGNETIEPQPERTARDKNLRLGRRILRKVEAFQGRHSAVGDPPVFANDLFPWIQPLEDATREIRTELDRILEHPEDIPAFHQITPDQTRISTGDNWKTFAFFFFGARVD